MIPLATDETKADPDPQLASAQPLDAGIGGLSLIAA